MSHAVIAAEPVLRILAKRGIHVRAVGTQLALRPALAVTAKIVDLVTTHRVDLLAALALRSETLRTDHRRAYEDLVFRRRSSEEDTARLTAGVRRELDRMREEMETFPFTPTTWNWISVYELTHADESPICGMIYRTCGPASLG